MFARIGAQLNIAEDLGVDAELFYQGANATEQRAALATNLGATCDLSETVHRLGAIGTGLTNRAASNLASYYLGVQFTF